VAADRLEGTDNRLHELGRLATRRQAEYVELWEGAARKLMSSSYRSEDLLDDWFRLWGKTVRDLTAVAAVWWDAAVGGAPRRGVQRDGDRASRADKP
jgi:hypothetical protein